jgi:hypothetical protein
MVVDNDTLCIQGSTSVPIAMPGPLLSSLIRLCLKLLCSLRFKHLVKHCFKKVRNPTVPIRKSMQLLFGYANLICSHWFSS